jgi:hypothetical protein
MTAATVELCRLCAEPARVEIWSADRVCTISDVGLVLTVPAGTFTLARCTDNVRCGHVELVDRVEVA